MIFFVFRGVVLENETVFQVFKLTGEIYMRECKEPSVLSVLTFIISVVVGTGFVLKCASRLLRKIKFRHALQIALASVFAFGTFARFEVPSQHTTNSNTNDRYDQFSHIHEY